jgi:AmmeMemoRadiSam system protein B/AmmeMemoRadiSam system protein A
MTQSLDAVRKPAVAGMFYPAAPAALRGEIEGMLRAAEPAERATSWPKALIAPHAGTIYSGPIAASAYARLAPARGKVARVVLLGPAHRLGFRGIAAPASAFFETPLGRIAIDRGAVARALECPGVAELDRAFDGEHSLEVHLPFLQAMLGDFALAPFVVGGAAPGQVEGLLGALWGGPETLIVVSTDLSHYLDYGAAKRIDGRTCRAIERLEPETIEDDGACGRFPVKGLLEVARRRGMRATTLDLRNSGDTAGDKARVVGYGAWALEEEDAARLPDMERRTLAKIALESIRAGLETGRPLAFDLDKLPWSLRTHRASFVTLTIGGKLRGCIGTLAAERPLAQDVAQSAFAAAFQDPRFPKLTSAEFGAVDIEVSVLSIPSPVPASSEAELLKHLLPGRDGVILEAGAKRSTFLPDVWKSIPDPHAFLAALRAKAGMDATSWPKAMRAWRYRTEAFVLPVGGRGHA